MIIDASVVMAVVLLVLMILMAGLCLDFLVMSIRAWWRNRE